MSCAEEREYNRAWTPTRTFRTAGMGLESGKLGIDLLGSDVLISVGRAMAGSLADDVIQLRLPLKTEYLPVLRAAVGVLAAAMEFNYDEIIHLRVAMSEVFDLAIRQVAPTQRAPRLDEIAVSFVIGADRLEILLNPPVDHADRHTWGNEESQAVLMDLMDQVEFGSDKPLVRMVKYRSAEQSDREVRG